ncbi:MAG: DUF4250 domain-containing protein [Subdoligranulum sp.]
MLPADPIILLSYIHTQLRDHYASLDALCADQDAEKDAICANWPMLAIIQRQPQPVCVTVLITPHVFARHFAPQGVRCCFW